MSDVRAVVERELPVALAAHPELAERIDAVLQLEITGDGGGTWVIDLTRQHGPPSVRPGADPNARCRNRVAAPDFADLLAGRMRWTDAFVRGKLTLDGDLVLALKLRRVFAELHSSRF